MKRSATIEVPVWLVAGLVASYLVQTAVAIVQIAILVVK